MLLELVERAPCHIVIVKAGGENRTARRVLVPIDGSQVSRIAAELALHYAVAVGAELTLAVLSDRSPASHFDSLHDGANSPQSASVMQSDPRSGVSYSVSPPPDAPPSSPAQTTDEELSRISPVFRVSKLR